MERIKVIAETDQRPVALVSRMAIEAGLPTLESRLGIKPTKKPDRMTPKEIEAETKRTLAAEKKMRKKP